MQQRLAEKEKQQKEDQLRELAKRAREERSSMSSHRRPRSRGRDGSRSPASSYSSYTSSSDSEDSAARERIRARRERRREDEREFRQARMGTERKMQMLAREQNRDISEKVALGLAKPTASAETMYDSRLFNQTSGFDSGFNEDQPYDKPLFAAQDAISSIYRPKAGNDDDEYDDDTAAAETSKIAKSSRFEALGKAPKEGFKGAAEQDEREGPVQFERDKDDPFGIDQMIGEVTGGAAAGGGRGDKKRYGIQEREEGGEGRRKRARVDEDDD